MKNTQSKLKPQPTKKHTNKIVIKLEYKKGSSVADSVNVSASCSTVDLLFAAMRLYDLANEHAIKNTGESCLAFTARRFEMSSHNAQ